MKTPTARSVSSTDPEKAASASSRAARAQPGQVREEADRDSLEDEQRRSRKHQHVEDEAGGRRTVDCVDQQRARVEEDLLAEHDQQHGAGEGAATGQHGARPIVARDRRRRGGSAHGPAPERERDDHEREERCRDDPGRDRVPSGGDPDRDGERERHPRERLADEQAREQAEATLAGEIAAGEEAGGEGEDRADVHPVEGRRAGEQLVAQRLAQRERGDGESERDQSLDLRGGTQHRGRSAAPRVRRSATLREISCSTGRWSTEIVTKTADQSTTICP